jgi:hypothetical protein
VNETWRNTGFRFRGSVFVSLPKSWRGNGFGRLRYRNRHLRPPAVCDGDQPYDDADRHHAGADPPSPRQPWRHFLLGVKSRQDAILQAGPGFNATMLRQTSVQQFVDEPPVVKVFHVRSPNNALLVILWL